MSERRQVALLRELAHPLLKSYGMRDAQISLLNHGFNTTFRVDSKGKKFALRINMNSVKSHEGVLAEVQLVRFLAEQGFPCPKPLALKSGEFVGRVFVEPFGREVDAVLYDWLPGSMLADKPTEPKWFEAGRLMAELHGLTKNWQPTSPADLPQVDGALMGVEFRIGKSQHEAITDELRELSADLITQIDVFFSKQRRKYAPRLIHTDMHGENLMSNRGKISVFDFDDAGMGYEIQDLANSVFYMRDEPKFEVALREGYQSVAALPEATELEFEQLLAARTVLLLNDLLNTKNAELYAFIPEYAGKVLWRLQNLRDTGRYAPAAG
jgi:Ser/Thr protein kinase RdoA (MazF antagonist)